MFGSAHASTQIPVRPSDGAAVADHWRGQLGQAPVRRFVRPAARLRLWDGSSSSEPDPTPLRPIPAVLWVRGRPVSVYLELSAWSATSTTVAIRPRRLSLLIGTQRYATAAHRALDGIAEGFGGRTKRSRTVVPVSGASPSLRTRPPGRRETCRSQKVIRPISFM